MLRNARTIFTPVYVESRGAEKRVGRVYGMVRRAADPRPGVTSRSRERNDRSSLTGEHSLCIQIVRFVDLRGEPRAANGDKAVNA